MRNAVLMAAGVALFGFNAAAQTPAATAPVTTAPSATAPAASAAGAGQLKTEDEKTIYALGLSIGRSIEIFQLTKPELAIVQKALTDHSNGVKPAVAVEEYGPKLQALAKGRQEKVSKAYMDKASKEKGVQKIAGGILYTELKAGKGESPKPTDKVKVHYRGTLTNGTEFDSSYKRNEPAEFPLNGVIKCWTDGVQKMKAGGKARLVCPSDVAYGERGSPPTIPPGATLVFEVELLEIKKS